MNAPRIGSLRLRVLAGSFLVVSAWSEAAPPTYHEQVAPILQEHCTPCHRPGQPGPFPLQTYSEARKHALDIVEVTARRLMPPCPPEPGAHPFVGERRLGAADQRTLKDWVESGMPEGDPSKSPAPRTWPSGWQLGPPDLILKPEAPFEVPAEGRDLYRSFVLPTGLSEKRHVTAWELRPNSRAAHHAFLYVDRSGEARRRDAQDAAPGFPGMDTPPGVEAPNGHFASWQPGAAPIRNPPGLGWTLEPGSDLMLQFHLQPVGRIQSFQPEIGLYFTDQAPTNRPVKLGLVNYDFEIPAGTDSVIARDEFLLPADVLLLGVLPHTHYLGHRVEAQAVLPDGTVDPLLLILDWDFNWQGAYLYRDPVFLPAGTRLTMAIQFDNSTGNPQNPFSPPRTIRFGPDTTDEMAEMWFQLLPMNPEGAAALDRALIERTIRDNTAYYGRRLALNPRDVPAMIQLGRTLLARRQFAEAEARFREATRLAPGSDDAQYYLGLACRIQNRLGEAAAAFRKALELNPNHARAHGNLGLMHLGAGRADVAAFHLKAAADLDPTDTLARSALDQLRMEQDRREEASSQPPK